MITLFSRLLLLVTVLATLLTFPALTVTAQSKDSVCGGVSQLSGGAGCTPPAGTPSVNKIVRLGLQIFSFVVGVIAVFIIMIAGLTIMTSGGDSSKVAKARESIIYAAVGLVIAALAQIIVQFIIKEAAEV